MTLIRIARYYNPAVEIDMAGVSAKFQDRQGLTLRFKIKRTMLPAPDTARAEIVNMAAPRREALSALYSALGQGTLTIRGGYDNVLAGMFRGDIRTLSPTKRNGPDVSTMATADDGGDAFSDIPIRVSSVGMTAANMIDVATTAMGLVQHPSVAAVVAQTDPGRQGPYTAVMTSKASDLLTAACRRLRCRWWVRDGQVLLGFRGRADQTRPAVLVTDQTLVGEPEVDGSGLMRLPVMLDPNIVPGGQVAYQAQHLRVESVVHSGDTRGLLTSDVAGRVL